MRKGSKHTRKTRKKMSELRKGKYKENSPNYGKKLNKEHKEKISKALKGRKITWNDKISKALKGNQNCKGNKHTEETKRKMREVAKGRIFSEEHKKNISIAKRGNCYGENNNFYGKKHTDEAKKKISENHEYSYGENHPSWKGGIAAEPYCDVWIDKEYKESIKERDNHTCQNPFCLCDNSNLCIHHINYIKKDCHPNNLITICHSSNSKANKDRWFWQEIYEKIIYNIKYV